MLTAAATASLLPYLTIHMQSIGLTVDEISMVYLALPLTTFLSPPITGKYSQFRGCLVSIISPSYSLFKTMLSFQYHPLCICVCVCQRGREGEREREREREGGELSSSSNFWYKCVILLHVIINFIYSC
jgi:hypothetical protein